MSSHHIVREAQEPALFIWQPQAAAAGELSQLLEWSPTVVVKEDTLEAVLEQGIKVDIVLYTPENKAVISRKADFQLHIQLISSATSEGMLDTALRHLASQGQQAINILTADASALDYLLPALASQCSLPYVVVLTGPEKWSFYRSGHFSKWLPEGEEIKIKAAAGVELSSKGFAGTRKERPANQPLILHTTKGGHKSIRANGPFWIAEKLA